MLRKGVSERWMEFPYQCLPRIEAEDAHEEEVEDSSQSLPVTQSIPTRYNILFPNAKLCRETVMLHFQLQTDTTNNIIDVELNPSNFRTKTLTM